MARKPGSRTRKKSSATDSKDKTKNTAGKATTEEVNVSEELEMQEVGDDDQQEEEQGTTNQQQAEIEVVEAAIVRQEQKEEIEPLTEEERTRFQELEDETLDALQEAKKSLLRAARSLKEIRDDDLFREDYPTFEAYCEQKLGFSKRFINYQINYAKVVDNFQQREQDVPVLPSSESQVRPLAGLKPEDQREVWSKAVDVAKGNVPSREIVAEVVQAYRTEQKQGKKKKKGKKRTIEVGDCIRIKGIPTTELSAYRNWWGFVKDITDDLYEIELPHTTILGVKLSNIALETAGERALNKKQTETKRKLFERLVEIHRLKTETVEDEELLEYLFSYFVTLKPRKQVNKQGKTTWSVTLTPFEEKALGLIERAVKKS